ncbi:MAG: hypothetical protein KBT09_01075, partial [Bacteroidales bacterium]|nr:hypothetical protein [Candidatus Sodaliphilus fimicaballi]
MNNETYNPNIANATKGHDEKKSNDLRPKDTAHNETVLQRFGAFFKNGRTRIIFAIICSLTAIYLALSFLSFFTGAGMNDQSRVSNFGVI